MSSKNQPVNLSEQESFVPHIDWLLRSFKVTGDKGSSAGYSLWRGWDSGYPETTGYSIPTLFNFSLRSDYRKDEIADTCQRAGDWLLSIQKKDGSFPGLNEELSYVFDTGQILFGLLALYRYTKQKKYLDAAVRAADWLCSVQERDGSWARFTFRNQPHAYDSRVAWGLIELGKLTDRNPLNEAGIRHLDWILSQQQENGWFNHSGFDSGIAGLHTIAYTLQGLIESGLLLREDRYVKAAKRNADVLLAFNRKGLLYDVFDYEWRSLSTHHCLTGLAQIALVWQRLADLFPDEQYIAQVDTVVRYLKKYQSITCRSRNIYGAFAGSEPVSGSYMPYTYPNWATKFFLDLSLLHVPISSQIKQTSYYKG